ncbi:MAG: phosphohydrolase, partial [Syntrophomonas sp.]
MANIAGFLWRKIASYFQRSSTKRLVGGLLFFLLTILVFYSKSTPSQLNMRADEVATRTIQSTVTAVVIDEKQTDEARRQASQRVQKVYQENKYAPTNARNDINTFYTNIN